MRAKTRCHAVLALASVSLVAPAAHAQSGPQIQITGMVDRTLNADAGDPSSQTFFEPFCVYMTEPGFYTIRATGEPVSSNVFPNLPYNLAISRSGVVTGNIPILGFTQVIDAASTLEIFNQPAASTANCVTQSDRSTRRSVALIVEHWPTTPGEGRISIRVDVMPE